MRYDMHPFLLPLPDLVYEEQMLWHLQNLQLGLCNDVYATSFVEKTYTWTLLALSIVLVIRWELTFYRHPERFSENTNDYLKCANCNEKLCAHKNQLHSLWKQVAAYMAKRRHQLEK